MTLFEQFKTNHNGGISSAPLADRMGPGTLNEFVGQKHLVGKGKILREIIENDRPYLIIFWGPPGSGKLLWLKSLPRKPKAGLSLFQQ
jgi:putative ATPase